MATTTLTFGPVTAVPSGGASAVVVGSGNQWSDGSDATYAELQRVPGYSGAAYAEQIEAPVMTAPAVTLTARISGPAGTGHRITPVFILLTPAQVAADPTGSGLPLGTEADGGVPLFYNDDLGGVMETDPDGLAHTYTVDLPYTTDPYGDGVWADFPERIAAGGLYMSTRVGFSDTTGDSYRVYEISLTLTTQGAPAPLRLYPQKHPRLWPKPRMRRPGAF